MGYSVPELLAPAGSLEKLKIAVLYGADAVYLAGQKFGLRTAADNFTYEELIQGVKFAHAHGTRVYVALNSFFHDQDLQDLPPFLEHLGELPVDALIVSDLGGIEVAKQHCQIPIHLSTQASCLNIESAKFWRDMGVKRVVLGREVSINDAAKIKAQAQLEVELFIHGSMCMSYSGNCVISNYTQGRDSNRGGCAHSCRFEYSFASEKHPELHARHAYFMSSKDLNGLHQLQDFIDAGIDSVKVEGRMKGPHYAGTVTKVYAEALRHYKAHGHFLSEDLHTWEAELAKLSHRSYTSASLLKPAGADSIYNQRETDNSDFEVVGTILEVQGPHMVVEVRKAFYPGDTLEILPFEGKPLHLTADSITDMMGTAYTKTKPGTLVRIPSHPGCAAWNIVRRQVQA